MCFQIQMLLLTDCRQALALIVEAIATVSKWMGLLSWALFNLQSLNYAYPFKVGLSPTHSLLPQPAGVPPLFFYFAFTSSMTYS